LEEREAAASWQFRIEKAIVNVCLAGKKESGSGVCGAGAVSPDIGGSPDRGEGWGFGCRGE
jgi:hypothetical protein